MYSICIMIIQQQKRNNLRDFVCAFVLSFAKRLELKYKRERKNTKKRKRKMFNMLTEF